jgi:hypothetical protein
MKCLILIFGESFRTGSQYSRTKGLSESYQGQLDACHSHLKFFKFLQTKYNIEISVSLLTYTTKFDKDLENLYHDYKKDIQDNSVREHILCQQLLSTFLSHYLCFSLLICKVFLFFSLLFHLARTAGQAL